MRKRSWKSGVSLMLAAALVTGSVSFAGPVTVEAAGDSTQAEATTYYIDAEAGDDSNNGTSEDTAWKTFANVDELRLTAGEKVLLKAGCVWNNEKLEIIEAAGTEDNPVILGRYGEGDDPIINGNGDPWLTDRSNLKKEDVAVVHVYNSKYITIQNLEVTNWESDAADLMGETSDTVIYDQSKYMLTGILVENHDAGDLPGVVIQDNYVHDVNGYMSKNGSEGDKKGSGGIMALVTGGTTESYYTDLTITGNKVEKVCHEAIYMESCWAARTLVGGASSQQAGSYKWVGWPDVYVANNYVNDVAGDGIVLINADGGVAEYNLVTGSASEDWNYSRNPAHAAIWMWDCNNVTMQYNEAAYTESTQDGMAFDCDYGNQNVMYQYNYSHDNKGGFWMACPGPYYTVNSVIRYNVSVNDGLFDGSRIIRVGEKGSIGHQFYNNTIYWDTDYEVNAVEQGSWGTPPTSGTDIYNNIFCGDTDQFVNNEGINYDNNCIWGSGADVYPLDEDVNAVIADPCFVDPEDCMDGSFEDGEVTLGSVDGLKLEANSPCINTGRDHMEVPEESLSAVASELVPTQITLENKDYEGNAVPYVTGRTETQRVDIGAFEYQGEGTYEAEEEAEKEYLTALVNMVAGYKEADFSADSWTELQTVAEKAKTVIARATSTQESVDAITTRLETTLLNMERAGAVREGTEEDDILAAYNSSDTIDNSGFEMSGSDWGYWQAAVAVSSEQAHTGSQSLKVVQSTSGTTGYSELGNVPVEMNTEYVLEAWVYCGDEDVTQVGLEAKHHKNYAGSDIKLASMNLKTDAESENGWYKATMNFTTQGYEKISVSLSSNLGTVYMDDVVLYPKQVVNKVVLDREELEVTLELVPTQMESYYSEKSWKAYQDALLAAMLENVNAMATQESLNQAATNLQNAFAGLTKQANFMVLEALYEAYAGRTQGNYTDESWAAFQKALKNAKTVLDNNDATQAEVDKALTDLKNASYNLKEKQTVKKNQVITCTKTYTKAYGVKPFKLNAKVKTGNGALSYKSSNSKVAAVSKNGQVTIKGTGSCTITVTAAATTQYNAGSVTVTIKVKPKKATLSSVKAVKGKKLTVKWKKDAKATGYEVQYCLKKNFKSGVKKVIVKKAGTTSTTIKKLKKGKKYYVRVRAYKTAKVNGKSTKLYGVWSKVKVSAKIK